MPIKKKTTVKKAPALGPKAKLMKLQVTTLRNKAKKLGISDVSKRSKENLAQSIILAEARKKRGTAAGKKATAARKAPKRRTLAAKDENRQTGKAADFERDYSRWAMLPGKRTTEWGTTYYERRKNRSDADGSFTGYGKRQKKGLGEKYNGWTNYWTWKYNLELLDEERWREFIEDGAYDSVYDLAKDIQEDAEEFIAEGITPDFAQSWFLAALSMVNWNEIAQSVAEGTDLEN